MNENILNERVNFDRLNVGDGLRLNPDAKWPNWCVDSVSRNENREGNVWVWIRNTANGREFSDSPVNFARRFPNALFGRRPL